VSITIQPARRVPLADRAVVASRRGLPWWGAVLVAFAMTGVGIAIDLTFGNTLTAIFLAFYVAGCLAAVLAVAHRGLFAAMVQPPLILALTVPLVVRALGTSTKGGMKDEVITLALPLVNGFPTMALTTLATVGLGVARIVIQRRAYPRADRGCAGGVPPAGSGAAAPGWRDLGKGSAVGKDGALGTGGAVGKRDADLRRNAARTQPPPPRLTTQRVARSLRSSRGSAKTKVSFAVVTGCTSP